MQRLSAQLLKQTDLPKGVIADCKTDLPERIIQFGEGNFLRGFVDWMIHRLNCEGKFNGRIVAIQPTPYGKIVPKLNAQDGLYTVALRGIVDGKIVDTVEIISSISRGINPYTNWNEVLKVAENKEVQFVFSNTTEAGLAYLKEDYCKDISPQSFPGKLTAFLYHRYRFFKGDAVAGMTIIPCELVEDNGDLLKEIVLRIAKDWGLPANFSQWIQSYNRFCNTLVDRIVTGYPDNIDEFQERLGYVDKLLTVGEPYHLFAIDTDTDPETKQVLPFQEIGLNVFWGNVEKLRDLKVRILNGAHTMMFATGYLYGANTVLQVMNDDLLYRYVRQGIYEEILPCFHFKEEQSRSFADSVVERFSNPFIQHFLVDIGMNATYKFKTRLLPTLLEWVQVKGTLPNVISFSLAALIAYYEPVRIEGSHLIGSRRGEEYQVRDNAEVIQFFYDTWIQYKEDKVTLSNIVNKVLGNRSLWGMNLNEVPELQDKVHDYLYVMVNRGMEQAIKQVVNV